MWTMSPSEMLPDHLRNDLGYAISYNNVQLPAEPKEILFELTGENDGAEWHWIAQLSNGEFAYLCGSCDYTGWD